MHMELCCFGTQGLAWLETHDSLAGWAQFLGAMLAIGITWWFAHAEAKRANRELFEARVRETDTARRSQEAEAQRLAAIRSSAAVLADLAANRLFAFEKPIREAPITALPALCVYLAQEIREIDGVLRTFPFWQLGSPETVAAFTAVLSNTNSTLFWLERTSASSHPVAESLLETIRERHADILQMRRVLAATPSN